MYDVLLKACSDFEKLSKKKPWSKKPPGWKEKSVKQYSKTMMKGEGHPFTACVKKMEKHMDNPEGFCASVKDKYKGDTDWRKNKKRKR